MQVLISLRKNDYMDPVPINIIDYHKVPTLMKKFIDWHKSLIERAQEQLGLSNYALYLTGILEGALYMWIILKVIPWIFGNKTEFPDF